MIGSDSIARYRQQKLRHKRVAGCLSGAINSSLCSSQPHAKPLLLLTTTPGRAILPCHWPLIPSASPFSSSTFIETFNRYIPAFWVLATPELLLLYYPGVPLISGPFAAFIALWTTILKTFLRHIRNFLWTHINRQEAVAIMSKVVRSVKNVTKGYSSVQVKVRNGRKIFSPYLTSD